LGDTGTQASLDNIHRELEALKKSARGEMTEAIGSLEAKLADLEKSSHPALTGEALKGIREDLHDLNRNLTRAISKSIGGEPGQTATDRELFINNQKVVVKASHREIYKGIAQVGSTVQPMNILNANTSSLFIDEVIGSRPSDTLTDITVAPLLKDEQFDVGLIEDLIFLNSLDGTPAGQNVGTLDITCPTGILTAEMRLSKDTIEFYRDKYGEEAFGGVNMSTENCPCRPEIREKLDAVHEEIYGNGSSEKVISFPRQYSVQQQDWICFQVTY
jgi:hypothetical protein